MIAPPIARKKPPTTAQVVMGSDRFVDKIEREASGSWEMAVISSSRMEWLTGLGEMVKWKQDGESHNYAGSSVGFKGPTVIWRGKNNTVI